MSTITNNFSNFETNTGAGESATSNIDVVSNVISDAPNSTIYCRPVSFSWHFHQTKEENNNFPTNNDATNQQQQVEQTLVEEAALAAAVDAAAAAAAAANFAAVPLISKAIDNTQQPHSSCLKLEVQIFMEAQGTDEGNVLIADRLDVLLQLTKRNNENYHAVLYQQEQDNYDEMGMVVALLNMDAQTTITENEQLMIRLRVSGGYCLEKIYNRPLVAFFQPRRQEADPALLRYAIYGMLARPLMNQVVQLSDPGDDEKEEDDDDDDDDDDFFFE